MSVIQGMICKPLVTSPETSIADAVAAMHQAQARYLVVVDQQILVGAVCDRTLITAIATGVDLQATPVNAIMACPLPTLSASKAQDLESITQAMQAEDSPYLAIVDEASQLQGLVTPETLVQYYQSTATSAPSDALAQLQQQVQTLEQQVSDRQLLEAKLRSSEGKIRAVFEAMKDLVFVCDLNGGEISNIEVAPTNSSEGCEPDAELISHTIDELWQDPDQQWSHIIQQRSQPKKPSILIINC